MDAHGLPVEAFGKERGRPLVEVGNLYDDVVVLCLRSGAGSLRGACRNHVHAHGVGESVGRQGVVLEYLGRSRFLYASLQSVLFV